MAEEGKNIVAKNLLDLQPSAVLEFFQLTLIDPKTQTEQQVFFHGGSLFGGSVTWQGNKYSAVPIECEGFEVLGDRTLPRPKIRVSNNNFLITALLQRFNDFVNGKVTRKKAFVKNLDDVNFDGGNPWSEANAGAEISSQTWIIGRKTQESKLFVEFELNSPLDLESFNVNDRSIVAKYCFWKYRGQGCRYEGLPIETEGAKAFKDKDGNAVTPTFTTSPDSDQTFFFQSPEAEWQIDKNYQKGDIIYVTGEPIPSILSSSTDGNAPTQPSKTVYVSVSGNNSGNHPNEGPSFWQKDVCAKNLSACRKRFNLNNQFTYIATATEATGFKVMNLSGNKIVDQSDAFNGAGLFHGPKVTGALTGAFTIMGWVSGNSLSSQKSSILSTTSRDNLNNFFNLNRKVTEDESKVNDIEFSDLLNDSTNNPPYANANYTVGEVDAGWNLYVITNQSDKSIRYINESSPTSFTVKRDQAPYPFIKFKQTLNLTYRKENPSFLPEHFTLGGIPLGDGKHASINGALGPWAIWNRALSDVEINYLRKDVYTPAKETIDFMPRNYYEITGDFGDVTGDSLLAWWDMSTGQIGSTTYTGLLDIHTGGNHLTGSGFFETGFYNIIRNDQIVVSNPSSYYPRFGGFPGTDGFGYYKSL